MCVCVCVSCWDLTEKEKYFLLSLSRKATGVEADFLGNETILVAFTFYFSRFSLVLITVIIVKWVKVALSHNEVLCVYCFYFVSVVFVVSWFALGFFLAGFVTPFQTW